MDMKILQKVIEDTQNEDLEDKTKKVVPADFLICNDFLWNIMF